MGDVRYRTNESESQTNEFSAGISQKLTTGTTSRRGETRMMLRTISPGKVSQMEVPIFHIE